MRGKRPTVNQSNFLRSKGLNPANWLIAKNTSTEMLIINRISKKKRIIHKGDQPS